MNIDKKYHELFVASSICILVLIFSAISYYTFFSLLNIINFPLIGILSVISAAATPFLLEKYFAFPVTNKKLALTLFFILFASLLLLSTYIIDQSWDGVCYHQEAAYELANGYNPAYQKLSTAVYNDFWINVYPKGPWIFSAIVYACTGQIEMAKILNLLLVFPCIVFVYVLARKLGLNLAKSLLISILCVLNPTAICQYFSFMVDATVYYTFVLISVSYILYFTGYNKRVSLLVAIISLCLMANAKLTGLAYAGVLTIGFLLFAIIRRENTRMLLRVFVIAYTLAIGFWGSNSYVKNILQEGNVIYPVNEKGIIPDVSPLNIQKKNRFERFYTSIFSRSEMVFPLNYTNVKIPFTINLPSEITVFKEGDVRIGSFGPFFSGILCLSFVLFSLTLLSNKISWQVTTVAIFILFVLFSTIFIHAETWWLRYVPQGYLIPVLFIFLGLFHLDRVLNAFAIAVALLLIVNSLIVGSAYIYLNRMETIAIQNQLNQLRESGGQVYLELKKKYFTGFRSCFIRLNEVGIKFDIVDSFIDLQCQRKELLGSKSEVYYCSTGEYNFAKASGLELASIDDFTHFLESEPLPGYINKDSYYDTSGNTRRYFFHLFQETDTWIGNEWHRDNVLPLWKKYKSENKLF